jgi:hypothetical protein
VIYWNGIKIEFYGYPKFNEECEKKEYSQEVLDDLMTGRKYTRIEYMPDKNIRTAYLCKRDV